MLLAGASLLKLIAASIQACDIYLVFTVEVMRQECMDTKGLEIIKFATRILLSFTYGSSTICIANQIS